MSAAEVLEKLVSAGIELFTEGDRLRYRAPAGAYTSALRAEVVAHKPALLALLTGSFRTEVDSWPEGDRETYEERAAILQYEAGMPRDRAEWLAYSMVAASRSGTLHDPFVQNFLQAFPGSTVLSVGTYPPDPPVEPRWCPCHAFHATAGCPYCGVPSVIWRSFDEPQRTPRLSDPVSRQAQAIASGRQPTSTMAPAIHRRVP